MDRVWKVTTGGGKSYPVYVDSVWKVTTGGGKSYPVFLYIFLFMLPTDISILLLDEWNLIDQSQIV